MLDNPIRDSSQQGTKARRAAVHVSHIAFSGQNGLEAAATLGKPEATTAAAVAE